MEEEALPGLDHRIASLAHGGAGWIVILAAILLGLRHATDPDHLTAVSTLIASERQRATRRAAALGLSWGVGHATTLLLFGLPIVLFRSYLPESIQHGAEVVIGLVIIALAIRLLRRWKCGQLHAHAHRRDGDAPRHLHAHESRIHRHEHTPGPGRSPAQAYAIGLIHGAGGSAGVGVLLLAAIPSRAVGVAGLTLFALGTAISMSIASTAFGYLITRGPINTRFAVLAPAVGTLSLAFGIWYAIGALRVLP